ncbi:MAG TPA: Nramp family divalent metal transporter [Streptosporangiaceae bacterium]|nr:Nramp family divalent metal transporter [Streptosporangiaceae bacterium]
MTDEKRTVRPEGQPRRIVPPGQPSAVLDQAHLGDIEGALGRIRVGEDQSRSGVRRRLVTFLAIVGPGLIVMVGDNDAGGVSTYAQAGQDYGYSLLWTLLLLIPVLIVNQEMVVRLGAVTGVGHARLINERFGRFWGWFSVGDLFVLNFLTIVTEFIGVSLALEYFGVSPYISVPMAGVILVVITASGSFRKWEQAMFGFIAVSIILFPMAFLSHPRWGSIAYHFVVPGVQGGFSSNAVLLIIAIVGTTVAPWQLFFQQSNVIDKRITPRFIRYERADTTLGAFVVIIGATAVLVTAVYAVRGTTHLAGHFTDALGVARALEQHHSRLLGAFFAIVLLDASIIGAAAVTLSTSYAFGDVFGIRHSLHRSFSDAKPFYASYTGMIALAAVIVLIPGAPLGLLTTAVQALAGILLPSASVFLLLLCNDKEVLGPWMNPRWLNILASFIVGVLVMLSGTLVVTTLFSSVNAVAAAAWISAGLVTAALGTGVWLWLTRSRRPPPAPHPRETMTPAERMNWRMPPLALLKPVRWSSGTKMGVLLLRGYLIVSVLLLVVKAVEVGSGH